MANLRLSKGNSKEIFEKKGGDQPPSCQTGITECSTTLNETAADGVNQFERFGEN